jgi:hypothetical protein
MRACVRDGWAYLSHAQNKLMHVQDSDKRIWKDGLSSLAYALHRRAWTPKWGGFYWVPSLLSSRPTRTRRSRVLTSLVCARS